MNISEIFYSIQGEGIFLGCPSVFVRTSGCNLRCGFCDTPHTSHHPEGKSMDIRSIIATANLVGGNKFHHVVITGGEPTINPGQLRILVDEFICAEKKVTIETNGTIFNPSIKPTLWSISPKTKNAEPLGPDQAKELELHRRNNTYDELPRFLTQNGVSTQFKFVVQSRADLPEIEQIVRTCGIPPGMVILMPEGRTHEEIIDRGRLCAEIAKETGYRTTPRWHVSLWGNVRGV